VLRIPFTREGNNDVLLNLLILGHAQIRLIFKTGNKMFLIYL